MLRSILFFFLYLTISGNCFCAPPGFTHNGFDYTYKQDIQQGDDTSCYLFTRTALPGLALYPSDMWRFCRNASSKDEAVFKVGKIPCEEINLLKIFSPKKNEYFLKFFGTPTSNSIVMEYCVNGDLMDYSNNVLSKLSEEEEVKRLIVILKKTLEALQFMHDKGYLHLDLKAENIFIDEYENPKIGDFGFSTQISKAKHLQDNEKCQGTQPFIAPESYHYQYSQKTDVFSIGMSFYYLCQKTMPTQKLTQISDDKTDDQQKKIAIYFLTNQFTKDIEHLQLDDDLLQCYLSCRTTLKQQFVMILHKMICPRYAQRIDVKESLILINRLLEKVSRGAST